MKKSIVPSNINIKKRNSLYLGCLENELISIHEI